MSEAAASPGMKAACQYVQSEKSVLVTSQRIMGPLPTLYPTHQEKEGGTLSSHETPPLRKEHRNGEPTGPG